MIVTLRARARADLREIAAFSAKQYGEERVAEYLRAVDTALALLCDHPELGMEYDERPDVRSYPVGQHRLYCLVSAKGLSVLRVLHRAMDTERHL